MEHYGMFKSLFIVALCLPLCFSKSTMSSVNMENITSMEMENALNLMEEVISGDSPTLCITKFFQSVHIPIETARYDNTRQKVDMSASVLQDLNLNHHTGLLETVGKNLVINDKDIYEARVLALNISTGAVISSVTWRRPKSISGSHSVTLLEINGPYRAKEDDLKKGVRPQGNYPWFEDSSMSPMMRPKFMKSPPDVYYKGWWTYPYYSCLAKKWLISYSVPIPPTKYNTRGFLSVDVDVSHLNVNQCDASEEDPENDRYISVFQGTHKCHEDTTECKYKRDRGWRRGSYDCACKAGYYKIGESYNGTIIEAAWNLKLLNLSDAYDTGFTCDKCAPGCDVCQDGSPCLTQYNWPYRIALLTCSLVCVIIALCLIIYVYYNRKMKVFHVASPIFLTIILCGCSIMYLEMVAVFPVLDMYTCIITKWSRHLGFCITYTALLMKIWRVTLTFRVRSAQKIRLTDRLLLQWMAPILLIMTVYLGTWTISDPPVGETMRDSDGLLFKQCTYNWWDHAIAIGEIMFLGWGVRICYNVRNAPSFFNEAKLISYAIYNIAAVNASMVVFEIVLLPNLGPDLKYFFGFVRTQLCTTVTIILVFGPKLVRIWRGRGNQIDDRARAKGVTASFSLNGHTPPADPPCSVQQQNEEMREEIEVLAANIEFLQNVRMAMNNCHSRFLTGHVKKKAILRQVCSPSPAIYITTAKEGAGTL